MILDKANTSTTILISHRLSNVVNADYIYVVRNGEIAECGTHKSLMSEKGFYYKMFELQAENYKWNILEVNKNDLQMVTI